MVLSIRQRKILGIVEENQLATVEDLCSALSVSEATVRRDLATLEANGLVNRTRGGALPASSVGYAPFVSDRAQYNLREKQEIAHAAVEMIDEGDVIAIDVGTTCLELAKLLGRFQRITVFTNSLLTAQALGNFSFTLHLIGGRLQRDEMSMVGNIARDTIMRFNFDKFFLAASGFDPETGPTDFNLDDVEVKQCYIERARQTIALVDHTKFDQVSLASICATEDLSHVVTDSGTPMDCVESIRSKGTAVVLGTPE